MAKKHTKKALFTSVMSLVLCFAMLVGTTFAWFTDSVTSGLNTIQSGNLDVVLQYKNNWSDEWADVDENTKLFNENALYEPGYTEVVFLRVANAGSLALKYNLHVNVAGETLATNIYGEQFSLKDYLEIGYYVQDEYSSGSNYADILIPTMFGTRESALSNVTTTVLSADAGFATENAPVLPGDQTAQVIAMVLTMPETVGNEANHMTGETAPSINLGVSLVATQHAHESDSFDNDYDKDAPIPIPVSNATDLAAMLNVGKNVVMTEDIADASVRTTAPYRNSYGSAQNGGVLDGNGKTLDFEVGPTDNNGKRDNYGIMTSGGTIKNVTITGVFRGIMIMDPTEDVYIDNVTIGGHEDMCYGVNTGEGDGTKKVVITNSDLKGWNSFGNTIKSLEFTNCTFGQGKYYDNVNGRLVKPYVDTVFENCEFSSKFYIDLSAFVGEKVVLRNCTVNGVKLTAENWTQLIAAEDICAEDQISIEAKDGSYMAAGNSLDYVVIE